MSNVFPDQLNNFVTGTNSGRLGTVGHAAAHNALEAKVGADGSNVTSSHDYKLSGVADGDKAASLEGNETLYYKTIQESEVVGSEIRASYIPSFYSDASLTKLITPPSATTTLVGRDTTDTLTNKTLDEPIIEFPDIYNATFSSTTTFTGLTGLLETTGGVLSATTTLTGIRVNKRVGTTTDSATPTPNADSNDIYTVTALAQAATFGAPTGTPTNGQTLVIRVKDNGTARALSFNASYRFSTDLPAPTTTVLSKTLYLSFMYNSADSKWDCLAVVNNF